MATLSITAFQHASMVPLGTPTEVDHVAIGAGSVQSEAIPGSTGEYRYVRLASDVDCRIWYGEDPDAAADYLPMGAFTPEYFWMESGWLVAVIQDS